MAQREFQQAHHISLSRRAEATADYLDNVQWGPPDAPDPATYRPKIITHDVPYDVSPPTLREVTDCIDSLKPRKAGGPDGTDADLYKLLSEHNRLHVHSIILDWWNAKTIPPEVLQARVVHLYKKGNTANLANYRPIALLNTIYKIYTKILHKRLADGIDPLLHRTQYGFRKARGTQQAIHIIRRLIEAGESTTNRLALILLDWEKAFDKITRFGLFESLHRMNIPPRTPTSHPIPVLPPTVPSHH